MKCIVYFLLFFIISPVFTALEKGTVILPEFENGSTILTMASGRSAKTDDDVIVFTIRLDVLTSPLMIACYVLLALLLLGGVYKIYGMWRLNSSINVLRRTQQVLARDNVMLKRLSLIDCLTGIHNRRILEVIGSIVWNTAKKYGHLLSVLMIDIDCFKEYNDTYGHQAGDIVLQIIAGVLQHRIRVKTDYAIRYGGDEFLLLLYDTPEEKTAEIAEDLRSKISCLHMHDKNNLRMPITASIGFFSGIPDNKCSLSSMIQCADCALYCAKQNGKNKVEMYTNRVAGILQHAKHGQIQ